MKVYEYLAAGLPVVTTPLPALDGTAGVQVAADAPATVAAVERALAGDGPEARRGRSAAARGHSWEARLAEIDSYLSGVGRA
jgi:glycosyltransferase involved in cell wall biosynthesis